MFKCNKCGCCCRHLDKSELYNELDRGDGTCKYLQGNLCTIYTERPLLCRIDECYEKFFKDQMTLEQYYKVNYEMCKEIRRWEE